MAGKVLKCLAFLVALLPFKARAQEVYVGGAANFMTSTPAITTLVLEPRRFASFDAGISWKTADCDISDVYAAPRLGVGFSYAGMGSCATVPGSRAGDAYSLYGFLKGDLLTLGAFSAGYQAQIGASLMTHQYHKTDNPDNLLYGGPFTFLANGGVFARVQLTQAWSLGLDVTFKHYSACRWFIPNRGVNAVCVGLNTGYSFGNSTVSPGGRRSSDPALKVNAPFRVAFFAGGGIHKCMAEFYADRLLPPEQRQDSYTPWFKGSAGVEAVWRYCRLTSTGLQLELHYLGNMSVLPGCDEALHGKKADTYCPWAPGVGLTQELYAGPFSVGMGIGAYLYRQVGLQEYHSPLYQKITLRYYPPVLKSLFFGVAVRMHTFNQADYLEFSFGKII